MRGILILLYLFYFSALYAQKNKPVANNPATEILTYSSSWGPVKSGNAPAAQIAAIAPAAVFVKDNKGQGYQVHSFRMNYKFRSSFKDDETEQLKYRDDLRVGDFSQSSQLPPVWAESIKDNVKSGDSILINKILFRNSSGKLQLAPDIRIAVK
jgi:hypothetical protein